MSEVETPNARLKRARIQSGYASAAAAARAFGWSIPSYSHHENGTRKLMPDVADRYAKAFGADAGWLLYGDGPSPPLDFNSPLELPEYKDVRAVPVTGHIQPGAWLDEGPRTKILSYVPFPEGDLADCDLFALRVRSDEENTVYSDGTIVIASPMHQLDVRDGDHIIIAYRNGTLVSRRIMIAKSGHRGVEFHAHHDDLNTSGETWGENDEDPDAEGIVVGTVRRRPRTGRTLTKHDRT